MPVLCLLFIDSCKGSPEEKKKKKKRVEVIKKTQKSIKVERGSFILCYKLVRAVFLMVKKNVLFVFSVYLNKPAMNGLFILLQAQRWIEGQRSFHSACIYTAIVSRYSMELWAYFNWCIKKNISWRNPNEIRLVSNIRFRFQFYWSPSSSHHHRF